MNLVTKTIKSKKFWATISKFLLEVSQNSKYRQCHHVVLGVTKIPDWNSYAYMSVNIDQNSLRRILF